MKKMNRFLVLSFLLAAFSVFVAAGPALAANFTGVYSENFNSMGTTGTALPTTGWTEWVLSGSSSTAITATNLANFTSVTNQAAALALNDSYSSFSSLSNTAGQWYNIARSTTTSDRVLSSSPSQIAGVAHQLELTNTTSALNNIVVSYDIVKFYTGGQGSSSPYQESEPGYRLWYAFGSTGGTWTNVSSLNPTLTNIPTGSISTTSYLKFSILNQSISLNQSWDPGEILYLRWVDDNALGLSPDQIIGLDNVQVVPIPAAAWLLGTGLVGLVALRRRMKK